MDFLLDVWREASQHIELDTSLERIARALPGHLAADALVVRGLNFHNHRLDTVAVGLRRPGPNLSRATTEYTQEQFTAVVAWCRRGLVLQGKTPGPADGLLPILAPQGVRGQWLAAPLIRDDQPLGVLLLLDLEMRFGRRHHRMVQALAEPIAVAFTNDAHYHELARLREAVEAENRALRTRLGRDSVSDTIVGIDAGLRSVMERIDQVAPTDVPVLIFGETGSGKEVLARAIHSRSRRAAAPIVRVNCGALPPGLIDSELFGHERGSFTGAVNVRKGWFERADGGTLFLDEIGELPLDAQVRLLRILQDGTFDRVGGQKPLKVDVRLVAATHRDLQAMIAAGTFREDLWYRISVFPIDLPPLRDRVEDIAALAAHFANRAGRRLGMGPLTVTREDIDLLTSYPWPGNVRELSAVIERAAILGNGSGLAVRAALGPIGTKPGRMAAGDWAKRATMIASIGETATLEAATRSHIIQALRATHGRIEGPFGAAMRLGVNAHTLRSRMRRLGIKWAAFRKDSARRRAPG
jgi:transcriptional regulator with GAF, ATPase, and Fis domain